MIDFDKTCAACGGMVADYGPEHGWMHIVSQYDNAPHDVVLSDEPEVGSPQDKIGTERQDHLPECLAHKDRDQYCCCPELRACEQRVFQEQIEGRHRDMVMAYLRGLDAAREAVAYLEKNDGAVYDSYQKALAAIDALREEQK